MRRVAQVATVFFAAATVGFVASGDSARSIAAAAVMFFSAIIAAVDDR